MTRIVLALTAIALAGSVIAGTPMSELGAGPMPFDPTLIWGVDHFYLNWGCHDYGGGVACF
ncbi:MAG: hypothetical protein AAFQ66_13475 [Pseudomonadota bacterium]